MHSLNFFVAAMQTGFGPFMSVWLVSKGWSLTQVGLALSIGTMAALCLQLPGGMLVDFVWRKRAITAAALAVVALSAVMIAVSPSVSAIWIAQILHSFGSVVIAPAIAALTLSLCGNEGFGERLGGNARYASLGSALAAGAFGLAATRLGQQSIFLIAAALALPAAASLLTLQQAPRRQTMDHGGAFGGPGNRGAPVWATLRDPTMLIFALCVMLFQIGNATLLPLALGRLSQRHEAWGFVVPAAIIVPQIIIAVCSPRVGAAARFLGRRKLLLVGFLALPARALLFLANPGPDGVVMIQVLDGVSATVLGLMPPLIAADLTRKTGHFNMAIGTFGLATGLGATFSTAAAGWVADRAGVDAAFLGLALVGGLATILVLLAMPETGPAAGSRKAGAWMTNGAPVAQEM